MILRILAILFPQVRTLLVDQTEVGKRVMRMATERAQCEQALVEANTRCQAIQERCQSAEARADRLESQLIDKLSNAGDSLSLKLTGRRMFSKAPVEAPPDQPDRGPINVSQGADKPFAFDVARQRNADFFKRRAQQAGVLPDSDSKPN